MGQDRKEKDYIFAWCVTRGEWGRETQIMNPAGPEGKVVSCTAWLWASSACKLVLAVGRLS